MCHWITHNDEDPQATRAVLVLGTHASRHGTERPLSAARSDAARIPPSIHRMTVEQHLGPTHRKAARACGNIRTTAKSDRSSTPNSRSQIPQSLNVSRTIAATGLGFSHVPSTTQSHDIARNAEVQPLARYLAGVPIGRRVLCMICEMQWNDLSSRAPFWPADNRHIQLPQRAQ